MYSYIKYEEKDYVGTITLNKLESYNAISDDIRNELRQVIDEINESDVRVVVITGHEKIFSAGGDVKVMKRNFEINPPYEERLETYRKDVADMVLKINSVRQPLIAVLNGPAYGAGVSLAALCDIRIARKGIKLGIPFSKRGLIPDWGSTHTLPQIIGISKTLLLAYTGDTISSEKAYEIGLVDLLIDENVFEKEVNELIKKIAKNSPVALQAAKAQIKETYYLGLEETLEREAVAQANCYVSDDHREGVSSFLEKREANFKGK